MSTADALAVLREQGPEPAAESRLLGGWLLARAGLSAGEGLTAAAAPGAGVAVTLGDGRVSGSARRVPWAREARRVAIALQGRVAVVERSEFDVRAGVNLAGEARDTVVFDAAPVRSGVGASEVELFLRGALTRIALMAWALDRVYEIAVRHARERHQFGRPIGSFQAVQQHLVTIAQQTALTAVAADATARTPRGFEIAAGKLLANRAALTAGRAAHQVLGARGTTREHPLGALTCRLWSWRSEYGDEQHWSIRLGTAAARAGADNLYPAITGGSAALTL